MYLLMVLLTNLIIELTQNVNNIKKKELNTGLIRLREVPSQREHLGRRECRM